jgi:hypothetical protein
MDLLEGGGLTRFARGISQDSFVGWAVVEPSAFMSTSAIMSVAFTAMI